VPRVLTLFEHEPKPYPWTDRDLARIEQLNLAYGAEVLRATVFRGEKVLQAVEYVGVIRLGARSIQVLPKIYKSATPVERRGGEATRNLLHMLAYAGQFAVREQDLAPLVSQQSDWFEILTRLFVSHLMEEWQRGAFLSYQAVEDELPLLKGKWRITDQLRRPERGHIFSVTYDTFSADTALNRVFRYVVERLWQFTRDGNNRQLLGELRQWMDEVTLLPVVTASNASPNLITRLTGRYEPLLNLARLFLDQRILQLSARDLSTFAFVLDMNRLFEAFVFHFIRRHRGQVLPADLQDCELLPQTRTAVRHLATHQDKNVFALKPDIAFRKPNGSFPLLLETKYKQLGLRERNLGVSQSDFYQVYAYARRYDCARVLILYPELETMPALSAHFQLAEERRITAATIDVRIDLQSSSERAKLLEQLKRILAENTND
jgi:5-methylcytosine-specific restriction enzyme subunit McrC